MKRNMQNALRIENELTIFRVQCGKIGFASAVKCEMNGNWMVDIGSSQFKIFQFTRHQNTQKHESTLCSIDFENIVDIVISYFNMGCIVLGCVACIVQNEWLAKLRI